MKTLAHLLGSTAVFSPPDAPAAGGGGDGGDAAAVAAAAAAAAAATKKEPDASFLGTDPDKIEQPNGSPAAFPDNWRDLMAGEDKDTRKALDRFKGPSDVAKSWREAAAAISKGVKAPARPADDQPEQLKQWRETMGIPPEATGYQLADPVAKRFTDADKPNMELFTTGMHKRDMPPNAVNAALDVYADMQDLVMSSMAARDKELNTSCQDELRQEWGSEFRANAELARAAAEKLTPGVNWFEARLPDGRRLGDIPGVVRTYAQLGKDQFGDVSFAGDTRTNVTEGRIAEIKKMMADDKSPYYTDGGKIKTEYQGLLEAKDRRPVRSGDKE